MAKKQELNIPGLGPSKTEALTEAGFDTLEKIAVAGVEKISAIKGISEDTAKDIVGYAKNQTGIGGFMEATKLVEKEASNPKLLTGSSGLDALLGGGVDAGRITEVYGEWGSCKTQIAHQLAVNCVRLWDKDVLWIDTEDTFSPKRIAEMCVPHGIDPAAVLARIHVCEATTVELQMEAAVRAMDFARKVPIGCLIEDSLTALFRLEWQGRGELADRQQSLLRHMGDLSAFGKAHNAVIFVTNQVMKDPGAPAFMDATKAAGGDIVGHTSKYRLYMRRAKDPKRIIRLVDSPNLPCGEAVISVTDAGISD